MWERISSRATSMTHSSEFFPLALFILTPETTAHWEGGQGKRDVTTMSKKDNKKYRGMNKTTSSVQKK
jgi:hypothetical protein